MSTECKACECRLGESCGYPAWLCCDTCTHLSDHVGALSGLLRGMARRVASFRETAAILADPETVAAIREGDEAVASGDLAPAVDLRALADDDFAANLLAANDSLGEAQTAIGMALGLDPPRTGKTWGAPEILARIAELDAQAERVRVRLRKLTAMEGRLMPLCPCRHPDDPVCDGAQQECPVHGDGKSFVDEVNGLRAVLQRAVEVAQKAPATPYEAAQVVVAIHIRGLAAS